MSSEGTPADASALIYLAKAGAFPAAHVVVGRILIPPQVCVEAVEAGERKGMGDPTRIRSAEQKDLLHRIALTPAAEGRASDIVRRFRLGGGESQVIAVAARIGQMILMDDRQGRRVARALGCMPIATVFLPVFGRRGGLLDAPASLDLLHRLARVVGLRADVLIRLETAIAKEPV